MSRRRLAPAAAAIAAAYALPYGLGAYPMQVVAVAIIFALLAIGLHLTLGMAGQINLAQVAFFGAGAYTTAILTTHYSIAFWPAAILGVLTAVAAGLIVGIPALRVQSHYLGIVGLGLAMVMVGGRHSLAGSVTGALVLTIARQLLLNVAAYAELGYGLLVVATVIVAPEGLAGLALRLRRQLRRARDMDAAAVAPYQPRLG